MSNFGKVDPMQMKLSAANDHFIGQFVRPFRSLPGGTNVHKLHLPMIISALTRASENDDPTVYGLAQWCRSQCV